MALGLLGMEMASFIPNLVSSGVTLFFFARPRIVLYSPDMLKHPFSITLFGDNMYWTDWDRNAIFQADKFNGMRASLVANSSMVIKSDQV